MTTLGIDYAWQHPDPGAIAQAGYSFACRYLSRDPSKNLTLAEARALAARGIWCVANWEYGAQDALRGKAGGIADAQLALSQAKAAGMPAGRPIYFSVDWDVTPGQEPTVLDYLSGVASVIGKGQTGEYAGYYPAKIASDAGYAWVWQSSAWSGGQWDGRADVRQTGSAVVGGVEVDVNEAQVADFGQWQPGRLPDIVEANVALTLADANLGADQVLNRALGEIDLSEKPTAGKRSLGNLVARSRAEHAEVLSKLDALAAAVAKIAAPVDAKTLAASIVTAVGPLIQQAVVTGVQLDEDHFAVVLEQHLAATLATPK